MPLNGRAIVEGIDSAHDFYAIAQFFNVLTSHV